MKLPGASSSDCSSVLTSLHSKIIIFCDNDCVGEENRAPALDRSKEQEKKTREPTESFSFSPGVLVFIISSVRDLTPRLGVKRIADECAGDSIWNHCCLNFSYLLLSRRFFRSCLVAAYGCAVESFPWELGFPLRRFPAAVLTMRHYFSEHLTTSPIFSTEEVARKRAFDDGVQQICAMRRSRRSLRWLVRFHCVNEHGGDRPYMIVRA